MAREDVLARVLAGDRNEGASVVIAAAASAKAQEQAITLATIRGRVSFFGGLPMTAPCAFVNSNLIHYRELSISGAYGSMPRLRNIPESAPPPFRRHRQSCRGRK